MAFTRVATLPTNAAPCKGSRSSYHTKSEPQTAMFNRRQNRFPLWAINVVAIGVTASAGCSTTPLARFRLWASGGWTADYETAEQRAETTGAPRVLYFRSGRPTPTDPAFAALRSPEIAPRLAGYVRGTLVQSHEPDRRYAAQFGVERAPAVILVHTDGTYHAHSESFKPGALARFIDQATPPGSMPVYNPFVPRTYRYEWITDFETASARSQQVGKPMVVAYERRLMGDTRRLSKMLATHEVGLRLADFVHCRVSLLPTVGDAFISPFGAIRLPALVMAYPDGRFDVLERPTSSDAVARFVDASVRGELAPPESASTTAAKATAP